MTSEQFGTRLYFEDLAVGRRVTTGSVAIDAEAIKAFAANSIRNPSTSMRSRPRTACSAAWSRAVGTAALTMRMLVTGGLRIAGGVIGAGGEVQWPRPTCPGDTLTVVCEVIAAKPSNLAIRPRHGDDPQRDVEPEGRGGSDHDRTPRRSASPSAA